MRPIVVVTALLAAAVALAGPVPQERSGENLELIVGRTGQTESGFVQIFGEVRNNTGGWVQMVRVDIDLLDADGNSLPVGSITSEMRGSSGEFSFGDRHFVPPGETTPFFYTRDARKIRGRYASQRLGPSARPIPASEAPKVTIEAFSTEKTEDKRHVASGVIKNVGTLGCRSPEAIITVYDTEGRLSHVEDHKPDAYFQKVLAAGQLAEFTTKIYNRVDFPFGEIRAVATCDDN